MNPRNIGNEPTECVYIAKWKRVRENADHWNFDFPMFNYYLFLWLCARPLHLDFSNIYLPEGV